MIRVGQLPGVRAFRPAFRRVAKQLRKLRGARNTQSLQRRWDTRRLVEHTPTHSFRLSGLHIAVINLPSRKDRLIEFSEEMARLGVKQFQVVEGISGRDLYPELPGDFSGAIGCNLAHAKAVEAIDWTTSNLLMVCEDDVEFLVDKSELESIVTEFVNNPNLDVLCIAGRVRGGKIRISERLFVATGIVGQACYVIKPNMPGKLAPLWRLGVNDLSKKRLRGKNDIIWNQIQKKDAFFGFPTRPFARQRASFSDIQGRMMPPQESN